MEKISPGILEELEACRVEGLNVFITRQLDRKLYESVNKVLMALGGKWNRKAKAHVFPDDPSARFEEAILTGTYSDTKKDFNVFVTPPELAQTIIRHAHLKGAVSELYPVPAILEPSAGRGALAYAAAEIVGKGPITCIEIQPDLAELLSKDFAVINRDFLEEEPLPWYNRIIMNPPFAVNGDRQADITHVMHAWKFLAPGGRLVAIMSMGVKFRENKKTVEFRKFLEENETEILINPAETFKSSGTSVSTITVIIDK